MKIFNRRKSQVPNPAPQRRERATDRYDPQTARWVPVDDGYYDDHDDLQLQFPHVADRRSASSRPQRTRPSVSDLDYLDNDPTQFYNNDHVDNADAYPAPQHQHRSQRPQPHNIERDLIASAAYTGEPDMSQLELGYDDRRALRPSDRLHPARYPQRTSTAPAMAEDHEVAARTSLPPTDDARTSTWSLRVIEHLPFLAILGLALFKAITLAHDQPLSIAEAQIWYFATHASDEAAKIAAGTNYSAFFNFIVSQSIAIFGDTPLSLRGASLFSYGLSIAIVYIFGVSLITRDIGLVFASLFAFSKFAVENAAIANPDILLPLPIFVLIFSAMHVHRVSSRITIVAAMLATVAILNLSAAGLVLVIAILFGAFLDAFAHLKTQFVRFSVWGLGQAIAIIVSLSWTQKHLALSELSWLSISDAIARAPQRLMDIADILGVNLYYAIPLGLGALLSLRTLVQATPLNTEEPIVIGNMLFSAVLAPIAFVLLIAASDSIAANSALLFSAFTVLIILSGIGLAFLSTRVAFHASFFVALFVLTGLMNSNMAAAPTIEMQPALAQYNSEPNPTGCVIVFPAKYQYLILYGIERKPECFYAANTESDVTPERIKGQNATLFFFPKVSGDGSYLRKVLQNFPQSNWQVQPQAYSGVLVIKLTQK